MGSTPSDRGPTFDPDDLAGPDPELGRALQSAYAQERDDPHHGTSEDEYPRALTVQQLAEYRLGRPAVTGADFWAAGLAIAGGCEDCHATIAAYNAYPSHSGYWRCADCIGEGGWTDLAEMAAAIFGPAVCPTCHRPLEADR